MTFAFNIWLGVGVFVGATWLIRHIIITGIIRNRQVLSSRTYADPPPLDLPHVTVVIAAKDEEKHIEACIRSLLRQDYPNFDLVVANDRSTDRTAEILEKLQNEFPEKLTAITIEHLPDNWFGKTHAVARAVKHAKGNYFLFSDADCDFTSTNAISTAVRHARENDIECLTVTPIVKIACLAESIIQPVCTAVLFLWHPPARVNNPKTKTSYANGAFILFQRDPYERIGGHAAVASIMLEDIAIARVAKSAGVRLRVIGNEDLYVTEMYDSLRAVKRGWSRIFQGSFQSPFKAALALFVLILFSLLPWVSAVAASIGLAVASVGTAQSWQTLAIIWWVAVLLEQSVVWRFYPLMRASAVKSLTYIVGVVATTIIVSDTVLKLAGVGRSKWGDLRKTAQPAPLPIESTPTTTHAD